MKRLITATATLATAAVAMAGMTGTADASPTFSCSPSWLYPEDQVDIWRSRGYGLTCDIARSVVGTYAYAPRWWKAERHDFMGLRPASVTRGSQWWRMSYREDPLGEELYVTARRGHKRIDWTDRTGS